MNLYGISVRYKLLVFSMLLVIGTGTLLGMLAERNGRKSLEALIGRQLAREARHAAERLSVRLGAELDLLTDFARQPVMREIVVRDVDKNIARALNALRADSALRVGYSLIDLSGEQVAWDDDNRLGREGIGIKQSVDRPKVIGLAGRNDTPPTLLLGVPVADPDRPEKRLGTLFALLDWHQAVSWPDALREQLERQGVEDLSIVTDASGQILHMSGPIGSPWRAEALPLTRWREATRAMSFASDEAGGWIVGRSALSDPVSEWSLLVVEPLSEALAPAAQLRRRLALVTIAAVAIGLLLAAISAESIIRPLRELTQAIKGLARSEAGQREQVPVRSQDELGALATAFNEMASELDEAQQELVETEKFAFVGEVAAGVAHQVRTSLGVLRTSAQMLRRTPTSTDDSETEEMLDMIVAEVERLSRVVDDLLHLEHGRSLVFREVDLNEIVRAAATFVRPRAVERDVDLRIELPAEAAPVICDRDAIEQVCINLLSNALACVNRGDRVEIRIDRDREGRIDLTVEDDGPGVPAALADRIFAPFVTGREDGVGLGLTYVQRIVTAHQWTVELVQQAGAGACFRIAIPIEPTGKESR